MALFLFAGASAAETEFYGKSDIPHVWYFGSAGETALETNVCRSATVSVFDRTENSSVRLYSCQGEATPLAECRGLGSFEGVNAYDTHEIGSTVGPFIRVIADSGPTNDLSTLEVSCARSGALGVDDLREAFRSVGAAESFYGIPAGFGANTRKLVYEFETDQPHIYTGLDRTDTDPANWETTTSAGAGNLSIGPWMTTISGVPAGTGCPLSCVVNLGNAFVTNDEAGHGYLDFWSDTVDNLAINVNRRSPWIWLSPAYDRSAALEYKIGVSEPDNIDMFIGICVSGARPLSSDGSVSTTSAGFHLLRTDGTGIPRVLAFGGTILPSPDMPVIPDFDDPVSGQTGLRKSWTRFGIKIDRFSVYKFYVNDVLVASSDSVSAPNLEMTPCFGAVTNGSIDEVEMFAIDRIREVQEDF